MTRPALLIAAFGVAGTLAAAIPPALGETADRARSFTIAAGGDVMVHSAIARRADANARGGGVYDFKPMFAPIEPWISGADLAICQMEATLSATNTRLSYYPRFIVPNELAEAVAFAGYDACSTASNHSMDGGTSGLEQTIELLAEAGIATTGTARSAEERLPNLYEVEGVTVGHMAYSYSTNGIPLTEPWSVNIIDIETILADAAWARQHGAEFVILSMHWGAEYRSSPTASQVSQAETLLASPDVDLILGHHVHVVQPIDRAGEKVVVYGMSNQISNIRGRSDGSRTGAEDGIVVHLEVTEQPDGSFLVTSVHYTPTWVDPNTYEIVPVGQALLVGREPQGALTASWQRTVSRVTSLGVTDVATTQVPWPEASCAGRPATAVGSPGTDVFLGTPGPDVIAARGGDDIVHGGDGNDVLCGGEGNDLLWGGAGDDLLEADGGADRLDGGEGSDRQLGGDGSDFLLGGSGDDRMWGGAGADLIWGGPGNDLILGMDGDDRLLGGPGLDHAHGGLGLDDCHQIAEAVSCDIRPGPRPAD